MQMEELCPPHLRLRANTYPLAATTPTSQNEKYQKNISKKILSALEASRKNK